MKKNKMDPYDLIKSCFINELNNNFQERNVFNEKQMNPSLLMTLAKEVFKNSSNDGNKESSLYQAFGDLFSDEAYQNIPWLDKAGLNKGKLQDGMLVRYRCMIQDIFDLEYYNGLVVYKPEGENKNISIKTTKYKDSLVLDTESVLETTMLTERLPLYCVPIPGEADWARIARLEHCVSESKLNESSKELVPSESIHEKYVSGFRKRTFESKDCHEDLSLKNRALFKNDKSLNTIKEVEASLTSQNALDILQQSIPITDDKVLSHDISCIVKVYDNAINSFKVNELVEFVGILAMNKVENSESSSNLDPLERKFLEVEISARCPPISLVPRLHCLQYCKNPPNFILKSMKINVTRVCFNNLVDFLVENIFMNDKMIAKYFILWLVSGVFGRPYDEVYIGKISLALTQLTSSEQSAAISNIVQSLLPRSQVICLNTNKLNEASLSPMKCNRKNRLRSSRLQTCNHTPIIIDETSLQSGKLNHIGTKNIQALKDLVMKQVVTYDFEFYSKEWHVDQPVLLLTLSKKPFIDGADIFVPFSSSNHYELLSKNEKKFNDEQINNIREYLDIVRNADKTKFVISHGVLEKIQDDFVKMRQLDTKIQHSHLSNLLNQARLLSNCQGDNFLTLEVWDEIVHMDKKLAKRKIS